jgi:hypothetical protein
MTTAILCAAGTIERLRRPQPWRMRRDQVRHRLHALGRAAQPAELAPVVQGMAADVVPRIAELDRGPRAQPGRAVGLGPLIGVGTKVPQTQNCLGRMQRKQSSDAQRSARRRMTPPRGCKGDEMQRTYPVLSCPT